MGMSRLQHLFLGSLLLITTTSRLSAEDICSTLPLLSPAGQQVVTKSFPNVDLKKVREIPRTILLQWLAETAANKSSSVAFFSDDRWRSPCWIYMSAQALAEADSLYILALIPTVRGVTTKGKPFAMRLLLSGFGEHRIHYNFEGEIVFKHPDLDNDKYILQSRVTLKTSGKGALEFTGATYTHWLVGDYPIRSIKGDGKNLTVRAGDVIKESKEEPMEPRKPKKNSAPQEEDFEFDDMSFSPDSVAFKGASVLTEGRL